MLTNRICRCVGWNRILLRIFGGVARSSEIFPIFFGFGREKCLLVMVFWSSGVGFFLFFLFFFFFFYYCGVFRAVG